MVSFNVYLIFSTMQILLFFPASKAQTKMEEAPADCSRPGFKTREALDSDPFTQKELEEARQIALDQHNCHRTFHGAPLMKYSCELEALAQHAAECNAKWDQMEHTQYGENIYTAWVGGRTPEPFKIPEMAKKAVKGWYSEYCWGTTDPSQSGKGHFTQLVWKSSVEVGMGFATITKGSGRSIYIVARYNPIGNFNTQTNLATEVGKLNIADDKMCPARDPTKQNKPSDAFCNNVNGDKVGGCENNGKKADDKDNGAEAVVHPKWGSLIILCLANVAFTTSTIWFF